MRNQINKQNCSLIVIFYKIWSLLNNQWARYYNSMLILKIHHMQSIKFFLPSNIWEMLRKFYWKLKFCRIKEDLIKKQKIWLISFHRVINYNKICQVKMDLKRFLDREIKNLILIILVKKMKKNKKLLENQKNKELNNMEKSIINN